MVLTVVDRAANAANTIRRRLILDRKAEINAVVPREVLRERLIILPDVDNKRMVRRFEPIDYAKALQTRIGCALVAIFEQRRVCDLLGIKRRDEGEDVEMRYVVYRLGCARAVIRGSWCHQQ